MIRVSQSDHAGQETDFVLIEILIVQLTISWSVMLLVLIFT